MQGKTSEGLLLVGRKTNKATMNKENKNNIFFKTRKKKTDIVQPKNDVKT